MHALNTLRLLSGIPVDPTLETKKLTEAKSVPLRRTDLTGKDQKSLSKKLVGLNTAIAHIQHAVKSLDKIPTTDFNGDIPHAIAELEDILDGSSGNTGLIHLIDSFDKAQKDHSKSERKAAKVQAEEEEAIQFNDEMKLDEEEQLTETWWDVVVRNHPDTDGFRVQANERMWAEAKAKIRLAQMRGDTGSITSVKADTTSKTDSMDTRIGKQIEDMDEEDRNALIKKADVKARSGTSSLTKQEEYLLRTNKYKNKVRNKSDDNDGDKEIDESVHYYVDNQYTNYEDDEDKPINVTDGSANDEQVWDNRSNSEDESPSQLQKQQDDAEKITIPSSIKQQLKTEIDQARKEAKLLDTSNQEAARFYNDLANAFENLLDKLSTGDVYDFKQAQIFAQSLMGPMLHKIPNDVWKFLVNGGKTRSLKSYMQEVKIK